MVTSPLAGLSDGLDDIFGVRTYGIKVTPVLRVLAVQVHGPGSGEDWLMLGRKLLERPGRSRILRADLSGLSVVQIRAKVSRTLLNGIKSLVPVENHVKRLGPKR